MRGVRRATAAAPAEVAVIEASRVKPALVRTALVRTAFAAAALVAAVPVATPADAGTRRDVQRVGLPFLYEALFAVANCSNVALDRRAFVRAARLYDLVPEDLTPFGPFADEILALDAADRLRLGDDRAAFCSMSRLSFAVPQGVLIDRGPVVPHPLPFAVPD